MGKAVILDWMGTLYDKERDLLFSHSEQVVRELKSRGYATAVISLCHGNIERRRNQIQRTGIQHYLDQIIVADEKSEEQFLKCISVLGSTAEDTSIIDDRTKRGIKIGNKLGCTTYWIRSGEYAHELPDSETGQPTRIIRSLMDILEHLR